VLPKVKITLQNTRFLRLKSLIAAAAAVVALALPASALDWPTKPVRIIYNYPAGAGGDLVLRTMADALSKKFGQTFVVENRSGAAGSVGIETAVRSTPDGYTFLGSPNAPLVLLPQLRKVPYDPAELRPITALGEYVYGWAVLPSLGVKTVAELMTLAKSKPGYLSYSSPGVGSATHLRGAVLNSLAGVDITHIPYRSGPDTLNDFLAGTVSIMLDNNHFPHVKAGKAIMLAVTTHSRHPDFPDVPTMAEAGYKIDLPTLLAFYAIKDTPDDIVRKFGEAASEIAKRPEVKRRLLDIGFIPVEANPDQVLEINKSAVKSYADWVKKLNFKLE